MEAARDYVLEQSDRAARRLEIQDARLGEQSEHLLDDLSLKQTDRVVELGCGPGGFSRRLLRRLGKGGALVGVDCSDSLLTQARSSLAGLSEARLEFVLADISELGAWLEGVHVVVGRTVLHHIPMVEFWLGRLRAALPRGTRVGFLEPDFRGPLARLTYLESTGKPELAPSRAWATAINQLYQARLLSPAVGASLERALQLAGYQRVRAEWSECRSDDLMVENMLMFYDEVRDRLAELNIMSAAEVEQQQHLLRSLTPSSLPAIWGMHRVVCET